MHIFKFFTQIFTKDDINSKSAKNYTQIMDENKSTQQAKDFLTNISPSIIRFEKDHYIVGNTYRKAIAIRGYPRETTEQGLLAYFAEKENITVKITTHKLTSIESDRRLDKATNASNASRAIAEKAHAQIRANADLDALHGAMERMHKERENLVLCTVYVEMVSKDLPHYKNWSMRSLAL